MELKPNSNGLDIIYIFFLRTRKSHQFGKSKSLRDSIDAQQLQYEKLKALHPEFTMFAKF